MVSKLGINSGIGVRVSRPGYKSWGVHRRYSDPLGESRKYKYRMLRLVLGLGPSPGVTMRYSVFRGAPLDPPHESSIVVCNHRYVHFTLGRCTRTFFTKPAPSLCCNYPFGSCHVLCRPQPLRSLANQMSYTNKALASEGE